MPESRVDVVIPLFNRGDLVIETLQSLLAQTTDAWTATVVDDGSIDHGPETVAAMSEGDPRIQLLPRRSPQKGASVCRNEGLESGQADYVVFLDSDDCLAPEALQRRVARMDERPDLDFGVFQAEIFDDVPGDCNLRWNVDTGRDPLNRFLAGDVVWPVSGPIWRRTTIMRLGGFDADRLSWQDWELHVRALIQGRRFESFPETDQFIRSGMQERVTIGRDSTERNHLKDHEAALIAVNNLLRNSGLQNREQSQLLGERCWRVAQQLREGGSPLNALGVWTRAWRRGWTSTSLFIKRAAPLAAQWIGWRRRPRIERRRAGGAVDGLVGTFHASSLDRSAVIDAQRVYLSMRGDGLHRVHSPSEAA